MSGLQVLWLMMGLVVVGLYVGIIYVAWRALFHDRARGRRRCPRCWYDMSRAPGLTCSECGQEARNERGLTKTRRRPVVAAVAVAVAVLFAGWAYWTAADFNWPRVVPTRVLLTGLPYVSNTTGWLHRELSRRTSLDDLTAGQWTALIDRAIEGDGAHVLHDRAWISKYGRLLSDCRGHLSSENEPDWAPQVRPRLKQVPPLIDLTSNTTWPYDAVPGFRLRFMDWWPRGGDCRLELRPELPDAAPIRVRRSSRRRSIVGFPITVPEAATVDGALTFTIDVDRLPAETVGATEDEQWESMARRTISVPIERGEVTMTTRGAEFNNTMARVFNQGVVRWNSGPAPVRFRFNPQHTYAEDFEGMAIGVSLEIAHRGQLARRLDMWWLAGLEVDDRNMGWTVAFEELDVLRRLTDGTDWTMTIRGTRALAVRAGVAETYWNGAITVPLIVDPEEGVAPDRNWWDTDNPPVYLRPSADDVSVPSEP